MTSHVGHYVECDQQRSDICSGAEIIPKVSKKLSLIFSFGKAPVSASFVAVNEGRLELCRSLHSAR